MTRDEKIEKLTEVLSVDKVFTQQAKERIEEKTDEQLDYILSPIDQCIYLEACTGSEKLKYWGLKRLMRFANGNLVKPESPF